MIELNNMPKLGFGLMRLPQTDGQIDYEQVCRMVDAYMASGLNYYKRNIPIIDLMKEAAEKLDK